MPYCKVHTIAGLYLWRYNTYGTSTKKSISYYEIGRILKYGTIIGSTAHNLNIKDMLQLNYLMIATIVKAQNLTNKAFVPSHVRYSQLNEHAKLHHWSSSRQIAEEGIYVGRASSQARS